MTASDARERLRFACPECGGAPCGMEIRHVYDGVLFWKCLTCGFAWTRASAVPRRAEIAQSYVDAINAGREAWAAPSRGGASERDDDTHCVTLGHEHIPAAVLGTYDDGDTYELRVRYCSDCAQRMVRAGEYVVTGTLPASGDEASS